ncbi:hypothetical protein I553_9992 [Mycobacterium xenopi 4042]|uniref:MIP18 family-like domain-containing protein n=1 Tax=Mycobacterium xenopi 4042 TaxID=1299334 RepID=X7YRA2_MYCXE|nr:hypothetical protein I553_9992 [Mycobacterium xenopi 4042]
MSETAAADSELLADVEEAMRDVVDPELGINVVDLGLVYSLNVAQTDEGTVALIDMTLTSPACPLTDIIEDQSRTALVGAGLVDDLRINWVWNPPWDRTRSPTTVASNFALSASQCDCPPISICTAEQVVDYSCR